MCKKCEDRTKNLRTLTIDVNGEKSSLTFKEATCNGVDEESAVEMVEEENPDCVILVYAIDDRETFGEYLFKAIFDIKFYLLQNLQKTCFFNFKEVEV